MIHSKSPTARKRATLAVGLSLSLTALSGAAAPALAAPLGDAPASPLAQAPIPGAVYALTGTAHLWIADAVGTLHWAGDTRALAGRDVQWSSRSEVTLPQLQSMRRGDPYLSAGLLKSGDPIYGVKWESGAPAPQLLQIQNIADVELFGINAANYGGMVLEEAAFEQRFGLETDTLMKGTLPAATAMGPSMAAPAVVLSAQRAEQYATDAGYLHEVDISGAMPGARLQVSGSVDVSGSSTQTFGPEDAGPVTAAGTLTWSREHPVYTGARYTFTDPSGATVTIVFTGDR